MAVIEYVYSAHSAFAYIGSRKLMEIAARHGCTLIHRPVDLRPVIEAAGGRHPAVRTPSRMAYFFGREIERWAVHRSVPIIDHRPTWHDAPIAMANGMIIAAVQQGADADTLAHALLEAHWRDDIDLSDRAAVATAAKAAGLDPDPLLDAAMSPEIQRIHDDNTRQAIARPVFGAPTYIVDGDMFFGQDRLELVERALIQPFPAPAFTNPPPPTA